MIFGQLQSQVFYSHIDPTVPLEFYLYLVMKPFTVLQFCCKELATLTHIS